MTLDTYAFWMSTPNLGYMEIAALNGFSRVVLDIEHNSFTPNDRESMILAAKKIGLGVFLKIEGPDIVWVQRAVDLDIDGVIIPHVKTAELAKKALETTKYPPLGSRSYSGGRSAGYIPVQDGYFATCNKNVLCLPMIETAEALEDIQAILALDVVDGIFVGPFDLALTRGRGNYRFGHDDRKDIATAAAAAKAANKPWWIPAWSPAEQVFAKDNGADVTVVAAEHQVLQTGLSQIIADLP